VTGYAAGEEFARSREAYAGIEEWLGGPEAVGLEHAELEEELAGRGRELQRRLLQDHLDARAAREQRRQDVAGPDGIARTRAEDGHSRLLSARFGQVTVERIAYRAPGAPNVHPADAELNLPPGRHSHGLSKMVVPGTAEVSFGAACERVARESGSPLGRRQCEELAVAAACDFGAFYAGRRPPAAAPGAVLGLTCDSKGITVLPSAMRPDQQRKARKAVPEQDGRLSRGEVRNRKRMAETGAVFDFTPAPRTPQDILDPGPGPRPDGPRAQDKWVTASITDDAATVADAIFAEADRRDPHRERAWIALADGNNHQINLLQAAAASRGITIPVICDYIHVLEKLWTAAWCFHPEASPEAGPWVRAQSEAILAGHAADVAAAIRARAAAQPLNAAKRKTAATVAAYLQNKAPYLDYPKALAEGWPISSGVIEGTCRHLIKDRMDITGARWGLATAEAILKLRALITNGDFDDYWKYHLQQEHRRNHPASYTLAA
jgi:hypothetical protein